MKNPEFVTVQDLYIYAMQHNLLDARIRICDGMAVSHKNELLENAIFPQ